MGVGVYGPGGVKSRDILTIRSLPQLVVFSHSVHQLGRQTGTDMQADRQADS